MIADLTRGERLGAMLILGALGLVGLAMAIGGRHDLLGIHGWIVLAVGLGGFIAVMRGKDAPEPSEERLNEYYDAPTRVGLILTLLWAVVGMGIGFWVAALLAWPEMTFDAAWASFGRLRPVHTSGVIFGFGGNALIATSFHVLQRTTRARLPDQISPWFVLLGYNLFCVLAASGYLMGLTQSKEYAEPEWYADIWLVVVWVSYFVLYMRTLARRKEPHIYVANWYYLAFILVVAILHIVNNLAVPVSLGGAKSYSLFSGVQDAMTEPLCTMELLNNQVTREQGIHSPRSNNPSFALYLMAENIAVPTTVLDFPTWDAFTREIETGGYTHVGLSFIIPNVLKAGHMARYVRKAAPQAKILVGGHGTAIPELRSLVDYDEICHGEGVAWLRRYFGEDPGRPIVHPAIRSSVNGHVYGAPIPGKSGIIIPGVGCQNACRFCATSHKFDRKYTPFLPTGRDIFAACRKAEDALGADDFGVMDENFCKNPGRARELLRLMEENKKAYSFALFSSA